MVLLFLFIDADHSNHSTSFIHNGLLVVIILLVNVLICNESILHLVALLRGDRFLVFTEIDLCDQSRALLFYLLKNSHIRFLETALQSKCIHVYVIHVHFYTSESKPSLATPKSKRTLVQKSLQRPFFVSYNQHQPSILYSFLKLDVLDREANFRGSIKPEKHKKLEPAHVILSWTEVG